MANNLSIESHLKDSLTEHMMAEISQGSIVNIESAIDWMKYTFMYIRMKNLKKKGDIDKQLREICENIFTKLKEINLISIESDQKNIITNSLGKKMSKHFIHFETIKHIFNIKDNSEEYILETLSNSHEFSKYRSKLDERKYLNDFNKDFGVKYKVKGCIDTHNKKAFILLQATLANLTVEHWELRRQQTDILSTSLRILNCVKEMFKQKNDCKGIIQCIILKKCLNQRMWIDSELISRQLPKIGDKLAKNLAKGGITTFDKIAKENPRRLETICGKNAPFGNVLIEIVNSIPVLNLNYELNKNFKSCIKLVLNVSLPYKKLINQEDFDPYTTYQIIIGDKDGKILFQRKVKPYSQDKKLYFTVNLERNSFPIYINAFSDKFIGLDKIIVISHPDDNEGSIVNRPVQKNLLNFREKTLVNNTNTSEQYEDETHTTVVKGSDETNVKKKREKKKKESNDGNISELLKNMRKNVTSNTTNKKENNVSNINNKLNSSDKQVCDFKTLGVSKFDLSNIDKLKFDEKFDNTTLIKNQPTNNIVINNNNNFIINTQSGNVQQVKPSSFLMKLNNIFD
jgi:hypothetical protein